MNLPLTTPETSVDVEIRFSYFVKGKDGKPSRVGLARVLDISKTGLCMEISPLDSDLFMESVGDLPAPNREIELQIFCRSHPHNIFVEGSVRWFKQKKEIGHSSDLDICAGVVFSIDDTAQKREMAELLRHLNSRDVRCRDCGMLVSVDGMICYECGARLSSRRDAIRSAFYDAIIPDDNSLSD